MKLSKLSKGLLAATVSLGVGLGITSCGESNTIDYLYVTANKEDPGQISVYRVDLESGALTQIQDSPYTTTDRDPVGLVTSPNGSYLYTIDQISNTIVKFDIGTDAKLYPRNTYNLVGSTPTSIAVNAAGTYLYVVNTYAPGYSSSNTGPGDLEVYPINSDGSLGSAITNGNVSYFTVQENPESVNVTENNDFVYVVNQNTSAGAGTISAFSVNTSTGALTTVSGSPFAAGVTPNSSVSDPTSRFYYVTDSSTNQLIAYTIGSTGALTPLENGPFSTGTYPDAVTIDPSGTYIYVANYNSNSVSAYQITQSTGAPSGLSGSATYSTDTGPTCVLVEPAFGKFLYTTNFLGNTISGFELNTNSGVLTGTENSPYPSAGQPTCVAAVTHGNHAGEHVQSTSGNGA
ncbi:lactonase family protein [Silvibacterium sp.]|uniref:lactonase family protein n=1 Tax=Silvibacterium sp. TaxID=1964179 RepID=UPI0039E45A19